MAIQIGNGECHCSNQPEEVLYTVPLGSSVAIALYDFTHHIGGIVCFLFPEFEKYTMLSHLYGNYTIPKLIRSLQSIGAKTKTMKATIAGGAHLANENNILNIGPRNIEISKSILKKNGIPIYKDVSHKNVTCSLQLKLDSGDTWLEIRGDKVDI